MTQARFAIVIPTFQADGWLDQALNSIFSQAGRHGVRIHLQDGGSTDATLEIAERWRALTENPASPFSQRLMMTVDSAPDGGLYDAVVRGFETLDPEPGELMTWLNADDLLAPGALASVASCLEELPDIDLCGGRVSMIDADGRVVRVNAPVALSRKLLAAGCHDGRRMPFVMQEGTFWRQELWAKVGGLDPSFRLAGDWDLWRRMARHAEFVTLDVLTAFHRRRPGQLSENLDAYFAEVDRRLTGDAREAYDHVYWSYIASGSKSGGQAFEGFEGPVAQLDRDSLLWSMTHRFGERLAPAVVQTASGKAATQRGGVLSGAKGFEGPYPEWDLPGGIRWITERHARLSIPTAGPGRHAVSLPCRPGVADLSVTIRSGEEVLLHATIDPQTPVRDQVLAFDLWTAGGETVLDVETTTPHGDPENRLLIVDITTLPQPGPEVLPSEPGGARVVVTADAQPQGLALSLASLAAQQPRPKVTVVSPVANAMQDAVIETWRPIICQRIIGGDGAGISSLAGAGRPDLMIEAGVRLAPGALVERLRGPGAARETDGRAVDWIRPAAALDAGVASAADGRATDDALTFGGPGDWLQPRPRFLRLIESGGGRVDTLDEVLARMDADLRVLSLPQAGETALIEAELKIWRPDVVLGVPAALALLPEAAPPMIGLDNEVAAAAFAAAERLALGRRRRAPARALFGLDPFETVWAVAPSDVAAARAEAGEAVTLLVLGEGAPPSDPRWVAAGPADDPGMLSWALAAADRFWTTHGTPDRLIKAARACGVGVTGAPVAKGAPLDAFARAMLDAASPDARPPLRRALRFRALPPVASGLFPGHAAAAADGDVEIAGEGVAYLSAPAPGPVRLRLAAQSKGVTAVAVRWPGGEETVGLEGGKAFFTLEAGGEAPVPVRIAPIGGGRRPAVRISLPEGRSGGLDQAAHTVPWEPRHGFGREEAPAPDLGLDSAFRWIEGRSARLAVLNDKPGSRRLTLTLSLRSLLADQRVMIRVGGRTVGEAAVEGGDLRQASVVSFDARFHEGWSDVDLRFRGVAAMPDRQLAAILDGVGLSETRHEKGVALIGWRDVDGFDFEEPPAPQFGLETAFRWRLPGARIAVSGARPGRHLVTVRYRTALQGQTVTATVRGLKVASQIAAEGRLDTDLVLAFPVELKDRPLEVALDADRYMEGDRPLGFIIQSVSVEPMV